MKKTPLVRKTPMPPSGPIKRKADKKTKHRRSMKTAAACANKEKSGKALTKSEIVKLAIIEWSKIVRANANGICEWCGKPAEHGHHMVARAQGYTLMFNLENGVALCAGCHNRFHHVESLSGWLKFKQQRPLSYEFVEERRNQTTKLLVGDLRAILADLRSKRKEMGA